MGLSVERRQDAVKTEELCDKWKERESVKTR